MSDFTQLNYRLIPQSGSSPASQLANRNPAILLASDGDSNLYGLGSSASTLRGALTGTSSFAKMLDWLGRPEWRYCGYNVSSRMLSAAVTQFSAGQTYRELLDSNAIVIVQVGQNDLADNQSSATVIANYQTLATAIKATGAKTILDPVMSRTDGFSSGQTQGGFNTAKAAVWAWATGNVSQWFDAVRAYNANLDDDAAANSTTYFDADKIHLNDTGHSLKGQLLAAAVNAVRPVTFADVFDGLVSHWPLNLKNGNNEYVDIVSGVNLTQVGTVNTVTTGRNGGTCANLPGTGTDYLRTGASASPLHTMYAGTIAGWVNGSSVVYGQLFGTGQGYGLFNSNAGGGTGLLDWTTFQPAGVMTAINGSWNHVAVTFQIEHTTGGGPGAVCQNYLNGVAVGSPYRVRNSGGFNGFGVGDNTGSSPAAIRASDVMFWKRQLSASQVAALYAMG